MPAPAVSAQSWSVYDMKTKELIFGKMEKERREIASLTKIMTCYTVLSLSDKLNLDKDTTMITISSEAANILGTSAEL
jgi:serine-type D-Ala-D-Ala carboxypeptidase (penicillin-binding protein 5/6)